MIIIKKKKMQQLYSIIAEKIEQDARISLTVSGNSMYPLLISSRDKVVIKKAQKIRKNDILLYQRENGEFILHRVVKINNGILSMAGDFETTIECPIYESQIIAKVEKIYRKKLKISCNNLIYKLYCIIWTLILPKRLAVLKLLKKIKE